MVTANAADLTDVQEKLGRIEPGKVADLAIFRLRTFAASPHRAVITANARGRGAHAARRASRCTASRRWWTRWAWATARRSTCAARRKVCVKARDRQGLLRAADDQRHQVPALLLQRGSARRARLLAAAALHQRRVPRQREQLQALQRCARERRTRMATASPMRRTTAPSSSTRSARWTTASRRTRTRTAWAMRATCARWRPTPPPAWCRPGMTRTGTAARTGRTTARTWPTRTRRTRTRMGTETCVTCAPSPTRVARRAR